MAQIKRVKVFPKVLSTTSQTRSSTPDFTIHNDRNKNIKVFGLSLTPNAIFQTKGMLFIDIDGYPFFDGAVADFKNNSVLNLVTVPDGFVFQKNTDIRFWITSSDGSAVEISTFTTIGEDD